MSKHGAIFIARGMTEEQLDLVERTIVEAADPEMERLAFEARLGGSNIISCLMTRIERLEAELSRREH
jgi:hypothetical protein